MTPSEFLLDLMVNLYAGCRCKPDGPWQHDIPPLISGRPYICLSQKAVIFACMGAHIRCMRLAGGPPLMLVSLGYCHVYHENRSALLAARDE